LPDCRTALSRRTLRAVDSLWIAIFMLLVLKIPLVYLGVVVWYAVKADPAPEGGDEAGVLSPLTPCGWDEWRDRRLAGARGRRPFRPTGRSAGRRMRRAAHAAAGS
jgi:hypothetical protein